MSSQHSTSLPASGSKARGEKRKRVRACDQCRRRKVKCNGTELPPGARCSNCISFGYSCTYVAASEKRFTDVEYVKGLENELAELRDLVNKLQAGDHAREQESTGTEGSSTPSAFPSPPVTVPGTQSPTGSYTHLLKSSGDPDDQEQLVDAFVSLNVNAKHTLFMGKSSSLAFIRTAKALREDYGSEIPEHPSRPQEDSRIRRPDFWEASAWLIREEPPHPANAFPKPQSLSRLIDSYFDHFNIHTPLLHRPTFESGVSTGLHLKDEGFGSTVLLVCAIGARHSNDPSTLPNGSTGWHWAGWELFQHVYAARKLARLFSPRLYDLQVCCLMAVYLGLSPVPHGLFAIVGHGLRLAQDMGAHRRATYGATPNAEDELKKRAFWCLVHFDRSAHESLGRPFGVQEDEFDVDFPIECDDEYWMNDDPKLAFQQPPGKPSTIALFNCLLRFGKIHGRVFRTISSLRPQKYWAEPESTQELVSALDSELNQFIDSIPPHLKWNPNQPDPVFLQQSALLYAQYYSLQITIHRAFIPTPGRPSFLALPSLALCTNAARSCIHVLETLQTRMGTEYFHYWHQLTLFNCAVIMLLNIWSARRAMSGKAVSGSEHAREMSEVQAAMRVLKELEPRWCNSGRLWDILYDLVTVIRGPAPSTKRDGKRPLKRTREDTIESTEERTAAGPSRSSGWQDSWGRAGFATSPQRYDGVPPVHTGEMSPFPAGDLLKFAPPTQAGDSSTLPSAPDMGDAAPGAFAGDTSVFPFAPDDTPMQPVYLSDPMSTFEPSGDFAQTQGQVDFDLEAIFADFLPAGSYEDALAAFRPPEPYVSPTEQPFQDEPSATVFSGMGTEVELSSHDEFHLGTSLRDMNPDWAVGPTSTSMWTASRPKQSDAGNETELFREQLGS